MNQIEIIRTEKKKEQRTYKVGQMFLRENDELAILVQVDVEEIALISISTGNRYNNLVKVSNTLCITHSEANQCSISFDEFTPVDTKITVIL